MMTNLFFYSCVADDDLPVMTMRLDVSMPKVIAKVQSIVLNFIQMLRKIVLMNFYVIFKPFSTIHYEITIIVFVISQE